MALQPCTNCGLVKRPKNNSVYVSWNADDSRVSKRVVLCRGCLEEYAEYVKSLKPLRNDDPDDTWPEDCSGCGSKLGEDFSPTYLTVFEAKQPSVSLVLATCEPCALNQRPTLTHNAISAQDRRNGDVGAPTSEALLPKPLAWA